MAEFGSDCMHAKSAWASEMSSDCETRSMKVVRLVERDENQHGVSVEC